ncbi:MAG: glycosyltransferase family 2 protein [Spirochaetia bacterium]|nr:glycosyltransferase family 2 protein [Spirochaetia bacterium]
MEKKIKEKKISVIVPVYKCIECLNDLYIQLKNVLLLISNNFEIIFINDASPDNTWHIIKNIAKKDKKVKGLNLSRNFGQHHAIIAGIDHVNSDWVVVIDCDLQENPADIKRLYDKAIEGFDMVLAKRITREDTFLKIFTSKIYFYIFNYFTDTKANNDIGNFGIYSKKVIESIKEFKEQNRVFSLLTNWTGFNRAVINITRYKRKSGKSSYNIRKLLKLAVESIISHSNKPLKFTVFLGLILSFSSFLIGLWLITQYYIYSISVKGWTSLIVSIYFLSGLILGAIGMLGLYIGKIFDQVKNRPFYIISDKINIK